jgi:Inverse autotransporter, beta-domain
MAAHFFLKLRAKELFLLLLCIVCPALLCAEDEASEMRRASIRHLEGKGLGYNSGETVVEAFLSSWLESRPSYLLFTDLRAHFLDDGEKAANAGVGLRYVFRENFFGINTFYDYRNSHRKGYHQVGIGMEYVTGPWRLNANGYFPVGAKKSAFFHIHKKIDYAFEGFSGHSLLLNKRTLIHKKREVALTGGDLELGTDLNQVSRWVSCFDCPIYAGIGTYYYDARKLKKHACGVKGRLKANVNPYVSFEVSGSYDSLFKGIVQGAVQLSFPLGGCNNSVCCFAGNEYLYDSVQRNDVMVLTKQKKHINKVKAVALIDPDTGAPFNFLFVNNTNGSLGNGSFEDPYDTLLAAQDNSSPNDVIYVFEGDGTSTGMSDGFVFQQDQSLLGSGTAQEFQGTQATVVVPPLTSGPPQITNLSGDIFILSNNNTVSGIHLAGSLTGGRAILGTDIANPTIINNLFTSSNQQVDIGLVNVSGDVTIGNNELTTSAVSSLSFGVILINSDSIQSQVLIDGNTFTGHGGEGIALEYNQNAIGGVNITNNTISAPAGVPHTVGAFVVTSNSAQVQLNLEGNAFFAHESASAFINSLDSSIFSANISGNEAFPGLVTGASYGILALQQIASQMSADFTNNTIGANSQSGSSFISGSSSTGTVSYTNNNISNSAQALPFFGGGIEIDATSTGNIEAKVIGNTLTNNLVEGGVGALNIGAGTLCLQLLDNVSNTGYTLRNVGAGVFNLEEGFESNVGAITEAGIISIVPAGTCD